MIKIKGKNNESHHLWVLLALLQKVTKERRGRLAEEEVWAGAVAVVEGDLLSQYFRASLGGSFEITPVDGWGRVGVGGKLEGR